MSDMLSIGASGLKAYQVALNTVSENISNAGTVGYSRRTASTVEVAATSANSTMNGMGSAVTGIVRAGDFYAAAQVRTSGSDLARTDTSVTWLDRIESGLDGNQLSTRLSNFFTASTTLAADPTSLGARASMLEAASGVAGAFSSTGAALDQVQQDLDGTAQSSVASLNSAMATLARINDGLSRATAGTSGAAALLDQRDQVLEQMSALTDVTVQLDSIGRATVRGGGSAGPVLVDAGQAATVVYATNSAGAVTYNVVNGASLQTLAPTGGALAGVVDSMQRIVDAKTQLQSLAKDFADGVNAIQAGGRDLDGNAGQPLFAMGTSGTAQMTMTLDDPRGIAAAAVGGGARDNTNLMSLAQLRTSAGYENRIVDMTTANAATLAQRKAVADAQSTIHDNAVAARDSASGVNLDTEAVDLMRFQQAYAATGRVIQVARETMQTILDIR
ncbi:MAG: flagellar hook-associated protein FlgK [Sphingomonas sp.]|uniref:flagellar hook-associated protein FlgK n=1 Tax=Sphingomonas sp. TaxID=28214 RepID=UPI003F7FAB28